MSITSPGLRIGWILTKPQKTNLILLRWAKINRSNLVGSVEFARIDSDHLFVLFPSHPVQIRTDAGHVEYGSKDRDPSQKVDRNREKPTKEDDETVQLHQHTHQGEPEQHHQDPSEEGRRPLCLVPLEKKSKCSLEPYNTG